MSGNEEGMYVHTYISKKLIVLYIRSYIHVYKCTCLFLRKYYNQNVYPSYGILFKNKHTTYNPFFSTKELFTFRYNIIKTIILCE